MHLLEDSGIKMFVVIGNIHLVKQGRPGFLGIWYTGAFKSGIRYIAA